MPLHAPAASRPFQRPAWVLFALLLFTVLVHLPTANQSFTADDYLDWAMVEGSPALHAMGFNKADPDKPLADKLLDGFHFFDANSDTLATYRQYGNVPWWGSDSATMVPFRPLAAATHWFDFHWLGKKIQLHYLHNLMYFLLLTVAAFAFFRCFDSRVAVPVLATALLIADFSLTRSYLWIIARNSYMALALGTLSLLMFIRWREQTGQIRYLWASLAMLLLALLSAEAAVSALAYMGAYVLCMERHRSLLHKIPPLLPFIALVVLWRMAYSNAGFGSLNIGQYVDPGRSPAAFAENFLTVFPLIGLSQITGIDSLSVMMDPAKLTVLVALGWALMLAGLGLILPLLKKNAATRFMVIGSVVAAIPGTALISGESRTMTFVSLGFFFVLAQWLAGLWQNSRETRKKWANAGLRLVVTVVLIVHLLFPTLAAFAFTLGSIPFAYRSNLYENVQPMLDAGHRSLVILNDPYGLFYYLPFEWAFHDWQLPENINILTPGLASFQLSRTAEREYLLEIPAGMPIQHKAPFTGSLDKAPLFSNAYGALIALAFFTSTDKAAHVGSLIQSGDMQVEILAENTVGPTRIQVQFTGPPHPDDKIWQWYDWTQKRYQTMANLKVGESIRIPSLLYP